MPKKGKKVKKVTRVRPKRRGVGFPSMDDLVSTVPKKGLLDPSLRRDMGKIPGLAQPD